jgi:hypothetical protein
MDAFIDELAAALKDGVRNHLARDREGAGHA